MENIVVYKTKAAMTISGFIKQHLIKKFSEDKQYHLHQEMMKLLLNLIFLKEMFNQASKSLMMACCQIDVRTVIIL